MKRFPWLLVIGDALALAVVVAIGLRTHQQESLLRLPYTWLPFLAAWLLAAWAIGALEAQRPLSWIFGRVLLASLLASPLAAVLRGAWLQMQVLPLFVLIMGATSAVGLILWRSIYAWWLARRNG